MPPHYAVAFVEVREYFGLRPSQVFRVMTRANTTATRASPAASSSRTNLSRASTSTGVTPRVQRLASTSASRPETVRAPDDGEELPPPPYAAEDPEPDATRMLQDQLAVAANNSRSSSDIERRQNTAASTSSFSLLGDGASARTADSGATGTAGDAPRPNDFPGSPAARVGNQRTSTDGAGPSAAVSSGREEETGPLTDAQRRARDEEQRAREASELDEALRASRAAEEERLEYEAAIQASLASAEEDTFRRSIHDNYHESPGAGPSSAAESSSAGLNRRPTSYQHRLPDESHGVQRSATSAGFGTTSPQPTLGVFNANFNKAQPSLPPQADDSLQEMFGGIEFNAPTLVPLPLDKGKGMRRSIELDDSFSVSSPKFQSNNPFLSGEERERLQAEADAAEAAQAAQSQAPMPSISSPQVLIRPGSQPNSPPPIPLRRLSSPSSPPAVPFRQPIHPTSPPALPTRPGVSPHTPPIAHASSGAPGDPQHVTALSKSPRPERALPPPPPEDEPAYNSPHGPPPGWQTEQHQSPPGPPPGWQAPMQSPPHLVLTTPSRNSSMNVNDTSASAHQHQLPPITEAHAQERASRPLPRPTGPPKLVPAPGVVSPLKQGAWVPPPAALRPDTPESAEGGSADWSDSSPSSPNASSLVPSQSAGRSPSPGLILDEAGENALEMLGDYDTVFLIDDSSSMVGERWEQAQKAIMGVVKQALRYNRNGIDCYFLNSKRVGKGLRAREDVEDLFAGLQPRGATPTGLRMEAILREYMSRLERAVAAQTPDDVPAMNLIVVTDGGKSIV